MSAGIEARAAKEPRRPKKGAGAIDLRDPLKTARIYMSRNQSDGHCTKRYQQGQFHSWNGYVYDPLPDDHVREIAYKFLAGEQPTRRAVGDFTDALKAAAHVAQTAPCWLDGAAGPDPSQLLPMRNGAVSLRTRELIPPTAALFACNGLEFDFDPRAPAPEAWLEFLDSLWPGDAESITTLQEFMGLVALTGDTSHQKGLMLIGPKRSGKGTILRTAAALAGSPNVCSPTLSSLGTHFGLQSLIGKRLAMLSDARVSSKSDMALVAESILRVTGEDYVTVPRKHIPDWHGRLQVRFWIASNELPSFVDASSALSSRFILMRLSRSFYGQEDHGLEARLLAELPGILLWAMDGLDRLRQRGRLLQPASAAGLVAELDRLASPVTAFVEEQCILEVGALIPVKELHDQWCEWCREAGHAHTSTEAIFSKNLYAAFPEVSKKQPREFNRKSVYAGIRLRRITDTDHWRAPPDMGVKGVKGSYPLQPHTRAHVGERSALSPLTPVTPLTALAANDYRKARDGE